MTKGNHTDGMIVPTMRYKDAPAAIDWLCDAFGFEKNLVVSDENGGIAHAQLTLGSGMIMLGSISDDEFGRNMSVPTDIGTTTQGAYIVVDDVDAHCARAKSAGAEILLELSDKDYGGRDYTCRDPEGHIWSFGTYDPWAE